MLWLQDTRRATYHDLLSLDGTTGYGGMTHQHGQQFPNPKKVLGRYFGPTRDIVLGMMALVSAKVLKTNGRIIYRSTFIAITDDKKNDPNIIKQDMETLFNRGIITKLGQPIQEEDAKADASAPEYIPFEEDDLGGDFQARDKTTSQNGMKST
jgi:hypothetical protein